MLAKHQRNITEFIKTAYHAYFGEKLGDQDKVLGTTQSVLSVCRATEKMDKYVYIYDILSIRVLTTNLLFVSSTFFYIVSM